MPKWSQSESIANPIPRITVWDDEKSAWRSIPLARLTELRIDGRAARGRTLKSVIPDRKHPTASRAPRMIELPRRRHRMPGIRQPPTDFRKLSPQLEVGYRILRHRCQREGPSVDRGNSARDASPAHAATARVRAIRRGIPRSSSPHINRGGMARQGKSGVTLLSAAENICVKRIFLLTFQTNAPRL